MLEAFAFLLSLWDGLPGDWWGKAVAVFLLWSEGSARLRVFHIELPFRIGNAQAVTIFPFVLYGRGHKTPCVVAHEKCHVKQVRKLGALLFYGRYLWLARDHGGGRAHPMEQPCYDVEDDCRHPAPPAQETAWPPS